MTLKLPTQNSSHLSSEQVVTSTPSDFDSAADGETRYLLGSAKNASRLRDSIAQLNAGNVHFQELSHQ